MKWKEIREKYPNKWVAIVNFTEDPDNPPNSQGELFAVAASERALVLMIKEQKGENIPLAIEFTGERLKDFAGGIWQIKELNSQEITD